MRICFKADVTGMVMVGLLSVLQPAMAAPPADYPIQPVPFQRVAVHDSFWSPKLETNRTVTVPYCFEQCEQTGRIANFAKAGGLKPGAFEGIFYNDSDVYKVIEGAAYSLAIHPDAKLEAYLDDLIAKIAAAQEDDGYLYTARTLRPNNPPGGSGPTRWSNLSHSHELYNVGHLYEAAVAYYRATGKRSLLNVARRNADLIDRVFGPHGRHDVPGHEEIEIGLVKLYRATGERRYLDLAKFFVDQRGRADHHKLYGPYAQDHLPITRQRQAVGHAVRAGYLYSGVADVAAMTGDHPDVVALDRIWNDVVGKKMSLTGGIGASRKGEAFGQAYDLPNDTVYNETCAAVANALWNQRMFLLHGDAEYIYVLECIIYNGFLSGVSLSGDRFFYPNPLMCDGPGDLFNQGTSERAPWFGTSCCPVNVVRFVPSVPGFVYAVRNKAVYVNLFIGGEVEISLSGRPIRIRQQTGYPWSGQVMLTLAPVQPQRFALMVRIPGWARGEVVPSDLYRFAEELDEPVTIVVNGKPWPVKIENGYVRMDRTWSAGDRVLLDLPMPVRRVVSHPNVLADRGRVALQRGPIVYCLEGPDNDDHVLNLMLPDDAKLTSEHRPNLLGGVTVLRGRGLSVQRRPDGSLATGPADLTAIPYYAWNNRGAGEMTVWIARRIDVARPLPALTAASESRPSASHIYPADTLDALNDQIEPATSGDESIPRFTWWDHRGTHEWTQYDFAEPTTASSVSVYWFDDTGHGQCRVPASWRILWRHGESDWQPVQKTTPYGVAKDQYNVVSFQPVKATALRLEVQLKPRYSGGILEWCVGTVK